jgi:predicted NUDIX family phosphoesterase
MPITKLHVHGIIFHVNDRTLEMSGNEKGDFEVKWLEVKENETDTRIMISKPTTDPFKTYLKNDIR